MKATELFKDKIKKYLDERAQTDTLFAEKYNNPDKKLDDCITYILNTVKSTGRNGFAAEEIHSMAVHYYDEDNIEVGERVNAMVVVNQSVELTDEEKNQARKDAIKKYQDDTIAKLKKKKATPKKAPKETVEQLNLFSL